MKEKLSIIHVNTFPHKATGRIMLSIHQQLIDQGYDSVAVWGRGRDAKDITEFTIKDDLGVKLHGLYTRITDKTGFASKKATRKLIAFFEAKQPQIVHLHNIHGYYVNIEMLFGYLRKKRIKVIWTLHDCWSITGHCAYFDMVNCQKWKTGCYQCPQKKVYPTSKVMDSSAWNWKQKKELFANQDITLVVPCEWLKTVVKKSYLCSYDIRVIYNGIDTEKYKPTIINSTAETLKRVEGKYVILGVASEWTERKGLKDFITLKSKLPGEQYVVVLVGLTRKQLRQLPEGVVGLQRTSNIEELVELYTRADIFFNPTYEDNFPTTNLESLACGTPIITYDTGGSAECLCGKRECGWIIPKGSIEMAVNIIVNHNGKKGCDSLLDKKFEKQCMINQYIELYKEILQ